MKTKTNFSLKVMTITFVGIALISGCKKDSSSEDWASGVAGVYTYQHNPPSTNYTTTINVIKLTNKTVSVDLTYTSQFSSDSYHHFITPVTLTSATVASFSTPTNDCDSAKLNPPPNQWVNYCNRYIGSATFSSNSINLKYDSYTTYEGDPENATPSTYTSVAAK